MLVKTHNAIDVIGLTVVLASDVQPEIDRLEAKHADAELRCLDLAKRLTEAENAVKDRQRIIAQAHHDRDNAQTNVRHWREQCGKLAAQLAIAEGKKELHEFKANLTAEIVKLEKKIKAIRGVCDDIADGAPDATDRDRFANEILGIIDR